MYIIVCKIDDQCKFDASGRALKVSALGLPRGIGWVGRAGIQDGGDTCTPVADSCQCIAKAITILYSNYTPTKVN